MATDVIMNFKRGGGSTLEVLYGDVSITPTLVHTLPGTAVLPAPTKRDLTDGQTTFSQVAPSPAPVEGMVEWAYKVRVSDTRGRSWEYLVGVPDVVGPVNFVDLPRYYTTEPPLFGEGPPGPAGQAATVAVGAVGSGETPSVVNVGTPNAAVLDFTLQQGPTGAMGVGVPAGGAALQVVRKDATNTTTEWATADKTMVGLGNVDNTSDMNKPVSTAQATAIAQSDTLADFTKFLVDTPTTYPEGISVVLGRTADGWPTLAGSSPLFVSVKTERPRGKQAVVQWVSPYVNLQADSEDTPAMLYRTSDSTGIWSTFHEVASVEKTIEVVSSEYSTRVQGNLAGAGQAANDAHQATMTNPVLVNETTTLEDLVARTGDGAKYFTLIRVGDKPGTWLDEYYGYITGHNSRYIWLVSGPTPLGPWTWREAVIGDSDTVSGGNSKSALVKNHIASPEAVWVNGVMHLYYHGHKFGEPPENVQQPTVLATSTNGRNFVEYGYVLPTSRGVNDASPYSTATSYMRITKDLNVFHAVWQGETVNTNGQVGITVRTVGHATSVDGKKWRMLPPLLTNAPLDQGPFGPSLRKVPSGWLLAVSYRKSDGVGGQIDEPRMYFSPTLQPGTFRLLGATILPDRGGRVQTAAQSPFFYLYQNRIFMYYGAPVVPGSVASINAAEVVWDN